MLVVWQLTAMRPEPVTEIDGTIAREFFTILNNAQPFSDEQSYNISIFSSLYSWLNSLYAGGVIESTASGLDKNFQEIIINYCLRLMEQSKLKPVQQTAQQQSKMDEAFSEIALLESIRILDLLCLMDSSLVQS
jgi:AP-5 complex subunit zeta-1